MSKTCQFCGFENLDDATFCESCGAKITGFVPPQMPPSALPTPPPAPAPPPAAPAAAPRPQPRVPAGKIKCALCGTENEPGTPYCDSCGAKLGEVAAPPGPSLPRVKLVLPQGEEIVVSSYPRTFGRSDFARIDKSEYISRKHFEISYESGRYYLVDTGSMNGTNVNNTRVTGKTEIKDGDLIELAGVISLTFQTPSS